MQRRTPQALHRVRGPSGPQRHWGVWCAAQFLHVIRLALRPPPPGSAGGDWSCNDVTLDIRLGQRTPVGLR